MAKSRIPLSENLLVKCEVTLAADSTYRGSVHVEPGTESGEFDLPLLAYHTYELRINRMALYRGVWSIQ